MGGGAALEGVRVLDLATVGPAARASRMLADYGAEVVKVGAVPRAGAVQIVPPYYAYSGNRGMRRALFDLKSDDGRSAFLRLAGTADVVIESFRPGVVDRLGIGYDALRAVNDRVILCSTSGYGQTGPRRDWAGHDVNYLAAGGFLDCTGRRADGRPALPGATVAAMAVMAALLRRHHTGVGEHLDVSIADGVVAMMSLYVDEYLATGVEPGPGHYILTGRYACYDLYECSDGRYVSVGAIEPQFWKNLCRLLDLDQYAGAQTDDEAQDEVRTALAAAFRTRTRDDWVAELGPADTCVAAVQTVAEAVEDPQVVSRRLIAEARAEGAGEFRQTAPIWAGTTPPDGPYDVREGTVTDTAELLAEVGDDDATIARLLDAGVVA
jgi:alpha-methylacyl-CoA racemase